MAKVTGYTSEIKQEHLTELLKVLAGHHKSLQKAFTWICTPHGHDYWRERHIGRVPMSLADMLYCAWFYQSAIEAGLTPPEQVPE